jgi:hypothetical protein
MQRHDSWTNDTITFKAKGEMSRLFTCSTTIEQFVTENKEVAIHFEKVFFKDITLEKHSQWD